MTFLEAFAGAFVGVLVTVGLVGAAAAQAKRRMLSKMTRKP